MTQNQTLTDQPGQKVNAMAFLRSVLVDRTLSADEVRSKSESVGLTWRSMQRASTALKVQRRKDGMAGGWLWTLASTALEDASVAGTFGVPATETLTAGRVTCLAAYNFEVPDDGLMHGVPHRD